MIALTNEESARIEINGAEYSLKPCPFCGSTDLSVLSLASSLGYECSSACAREGTHGWPKMAHTWYVNCPDCGAGGPLCYVTEMYRYDKDYKDDDDCKVDAIDGWNRRAWNG